MSEGRVLNDQLWERCAERADPFGRGRSQTIVEPRTPRRQSQEGVSGRVKVVGD